jgi:hypothetical protein
MIFKCPGQDDRNLKSDNISCPGCGFEMEIFSDEAKVKCPRCASIACKVRLPSCADWCKYAPQCLGDVKYNQKFADYLQ